MPTLKFRVIQVIDEFEDEIFAAFVTTIGGNPEDLLIWHSPEGHPPVYWAFPLTPEDKKTLEAGTTNCRDFFIKAPVIYRGASFQFTDEWTCWKEPEGEGVRRLDYEICTGSDLNPEYVPDEDIYLLDTPETLKARNPEKYDAFAQAFIKAAYEAVGHANARTAANEKQEPKCTTPKS